MPIPEEIVTLAIVGTEKSGYSIPLVANDLQNLLDQINTTPERQLLLTIAGLELRQRAGWIAPQADRLTVSQGPTDSQPVIGRKALRHLYLMLKGAYKDSLGEWLLLVAQSGQRAPEEAIPSLLELGRQNKDFRPAILSIIGERGKWLAHEATTRDWVWFEPRNFDRRWKKGSIETRLDLLAFIIREDRTKVRELLAETWSRETPKAKQAFLQLLADGLCKDDEPFLEHLLDIEQPDLRAKIGALLMRLEGSAYQQRAIERVLPFVEKSRKGLRIKAYPEWQASWARDGVKQVADNKSQLMELFRLAPPDQLSNALDVSMSTLVSWLAEKDQSVWFYSDIFPEWVANPVFNEWLLINYSDVWSNLGDNLVDMKLFIQHASPEVIRRELAHLINQLSLFYMVIIVLKPLPIIWDRELSHLVIQWVNSNQGRTIILPYPTNPPLDQYLRETGKGLQWLAQRIHLDEVNAFLQALQMIHNQATKEVDLPFVKTVSEEILESCRGILEFRDEMRSAIYETIKD